MQHPQKIAALIGTALAATALIAGTPAFAGNHGTARAVMVGGAAMLPTRDRKSVV